jgi:YVTN family beta-propeller protein
MEATVWRRRYWLGAGLLLVLGVAGVRMLTSTAGDPVLRTVTVGTYPHRCGRGRSDRPRLRHEHSGGVSLLDARDGRVLGTRAGTSAFGSIVLDGPTQRVFALSESGLVSGLITVLDGRTGAILRTTLDSVLDPMVDRQTGAILAAAIDPQNGQYDHLAFIDGHSGVLRRMVPLQGPLVLDVDSRTEHVFAANFATAPVSMLDARTGRLLRTVPVGPTPLGVAVDARTERVFVTNNGADTDNVLDAHTGMLLHTIKVGPHPARVVVDERTARVFVVHGRGGSTKEPFSFPDFEQSGVTMLDARTGAVLRSLPVGGSPFDDVESATATNIVVDARRGRVFVINQALLDRNGLPVSANGSVSVLDARSGGVLRTIAVGSNPIALAVDRVESTPLCGECERCVYSRHDRRRLDTTVGAPLVAFPPGACPSAL